MSKTEESLIEVLERRLRERFEEAETMVDQPRYRDKGTWFLKASLYGKDLRVEWSLECGFEITYWVASRSEPGAGRYKVVSSTQPDTVFDSVVAILSGGRHLERVR